MASYGRSESPPRGSWGYGDHDIDARPRRKRSFPEEEEEEVGWGGVGPPTWRPSERRASRERPRATSGREGRTGRGGPWPESRGVEEREGGKEVEVRGGGRSRSPWEGPRREPLPAREGGMGPWEPPQGRARSRSPPRGSDSGWRGPSPSGTRERAWRSPAASSRSSLLFPVSGRGEAERSSRWGASPGREGGAWAKGQPRSCQEEEEGRQWQHQKQQHQKQQHLSSGRMMGGRHVERSSSSTSSFRSRGAPGGEARQDRGQEWSYLEKDPHPRRRGGSAERRRAPEGSQGGFPTFPGEEGSWRNPSRERGQGGPAGVRRPWGSHAQAEVLEDPASSSLPSQLGWDQGESTWDSPERRGKEPESWTGGERLGMPPNPDEDLEDSEGPSSFREEWSPKEGRTITESFPGELGGRRDHPKIAPVSWVPREEVVDFWNQCQSILKKRVREYLLSTCPRPALPDRSSETPELNTNLLSLLNAKQVKTISRATSQIRFIQDEVLNMLAPAMTIYEMAEEAVEKGEAVDPLELREWIRRVIRYIGSINQRLLVLRRSEVLATINPRLRSVSTEMTGRSAGGMLFPEDKVKLLKEIIRKFPQLAQGPSLNPKNLHPGPRPNYVRRKPRLSKLGPRLQDGGGQHMSAGEKTTTEEGKAAFRLHSSRDPRRCTVAMVASLLTSVSATGS
ncbi:uncharacterized protein LOC110072577 isoform X1 [Pogona vitticeps]